jgi:hypothetical protein
MKQKYILFTVCILALLNVNGQITHEISFKDDFCLDITTLNDGSKYVKIGKANLQFIEEVGKPELPYKVLKFLLPANASEPRIEVVNVNCDSIKVEYPVLPAVKPVKIDSMPEKRKTYLTVEPQENAEMVYPANVINIEGVGKMREFNIATVSVFPFQYYALQQKLVFYQNIEFVIRYKLEGKSVNIKIFNDKKNIIKRDISNYVVNKDDIKRFYKTAENDYKAAPILKSNDNKTTSLGATLNCDYVIVTTNEYATDLGEFMAWKRRKGLKIEVVNIDEVLSSYSNSGDVVSGIDDDAGRLRQFLKDMYENNQSFQYALFVDDGNIPIRYLHDYEDETDSLLIYPSDYYFADFDIDWEKDGDNNHGEFSDSIWFYEPEIFVGRLLVKSTDELRNWIRKVILYETKPGNGDPYYLKKALSTDADNLKSYFVRNELTWCVADSVLEEGGYNTDSTPPSPTGAYIIDRLNEKYGVIVLGGHGSATTVAVATKGMNVNEPFSKYGVTSLDQYNNTSNTGCCLKYEDGNGIDNLTNVDHPAVCFSIACKNMPFDDYGYNANIRNVGESFTVISEGGGPIFIGNTRSGFSASTNCVMGRAVRFAANRTYFNIGKLLGFAKESGLYTSSYVKYSLNLLGCPETKLWTIVPTPFRDISVAQYSDHITITNIGERNAKYVVMSALDNGDTYHEVKYRPNSDTCSFYNVPEEYLLTVIDNSHLPYMKNPDVLYFQNETVSDDKYVYAGEIYAGENVTNLKPQGIFKISNGANVTFDVDGDVYLEPGFEVELGGEFEIK